MGSPKESTVKRLFAVSSNCCAFPNCKTLLVDQGQSKVIGEICHIKGNKPDAERYDLAQSEDERQGFDNLILLCPTHHTIVDSDPEAYTVERLTSMKQKHESKQAVPQELGNELVRQLIANLNVQATNGGSVVFSVNQAGGQTAHSITNIGYQPKRIPDSATADFIATMKPVARLQVAISSNLLDSKTEFLAEQLVELLQKAGWDASGDAKDMAPDLPKVIVFTTPQNFSPAQYDSLTRLAILLKRNGFEIHLHKNFLVPMTNIYIGGV